MSRAAVRAVVSALLWTSLSVPARKARADVPVELRGRPVVEVEVGGAAAGRISPREVGIPLGAPVSRRLLRKTTQRLVQSGRWADVQLDLIPADDGVRVLAHLVPRIVLQRIEIEHNNVLDDGEVRRLIRLTSGDEIRRARLDDAAQTVEEAYAKRGYEDAAVETTLRSTNDPGRKVLRVRVREGEATRITALELRGDELPRDGGGRALLEIDVGDVLDRARIEKKLRVVQARLHRERWLEAELGPPRFERRGTHGMAVFVPSHVGPRYRVRIRGAGRLPTHEVRASLKLGKERLTGDATLDGMRRRVVELYRKHGYPDVEVDVRRTGGEKEDVAWLLVDIEPGPRMEVVSVQFPGVEHFEASFLREQVHSYLQEAVGGEGILEPVDSHTVDRLGFGGNPRPHARSSPPPLEVEPRRVYYAPTYKKAIAHLVELYRRDGYLDAKVGPHRIARLGPHRARVTIPVVEGPQTLLQSVRVEGNSALTTRKIVEVSGLRRRMPFSRVALDRARARIEELYHEHGYLYARVAPEVHFSSDRSRAEIVLEIVERFQVRVGRIIVRGAERTSHALIRDRIALHSGDVYRPSLAHETQRELTSLDIFSGVTVAPQDAELPAPVKPVVVTVTERKAQFLDLTAGVSTGEGVRGGFRYGYRNIGGYGIGLRLRLQLGHQFFFIENQLQRRYRDLAVKDRLERDLTLGLTIPHIPRLHGVTTSVSLFHQRDNERDFGLDKNGIGLTVSYRPVEAVTIQVSEDLENNDVDLFIDNTSVEELLRNTDDRRLQQLLRVPEGSSTLVATRARISLDLRDHAFAPTRGIFASVSVEWARTLRTQDVEVADMRQEFFSHQLKSAASVSGYVPLGGGVVWANQVRLGGIVHLDEASETYPNRRFFLGGVNTLRGFLQDELVPQDLADRILANDDLGPNDVLRGGDAFVLWRSELRFPIAGSVRGGVFADLGNLWAQAARFDPLDLRPTAGLGLRLSTPVGPLAFDYGVVLDRRPQLNEPVGSFHFSMGVF